MRVITPETVWLAYRCLWIYAKFTRVEGRLKVPEHLPKVIPAKKYPLVKELANQINEADKNYIVQCDELYYCYLYLFVQLLRCSVKSAPYFIGEADGWTNLEWFPIGVLKGREGIANRTWAAWYAAHIQSKNETETTLSRLYPMLLEAGRAELLQVQRQMVVLERIKKEWGASSFEVYEHFLLNGLKRPIGDKIPWHKWIGLALPDAWESLQYPTLRKALEQVMLEGVDAWKTFVEEVVPLVHKGENLRNVRNNLLTSIDRSLKVIKDTGVKKRWKVWRRYLLPNPNGKN